MVAAMGYEGDLVRPRLERGCRCFARVLAGEVVAYGWLSVGAEWIGELGLEIRPPAGEAYIWNCVTLPAHRFQGHFRALLQHLVETAQDERIPRLWIGSIDGMAESAVFGAGFQPVLHFRVATLLGVRWLSATAAAGADPSTVGAALESLASGTSLLRPGIRRAISRRH